MFAVPVHAVDWSKTHKDYICMFINGGWKATSVRRFDGEVSFVLEGKEVSPTHVMNHDGKIALIPSARLSGKSFPPPKE